MLKLIVLIALPEAAMAAGPPVSIPEPGDLGLLVLAVAGLIIGRHASRKAPRERNDG